MKRQWVGLAGACAVVLAAAGCASTQPDVADYPSVDACKVLPVAAISAATGVSIDGPGVHDPAPLVGEIKSECYYGGSGSPGGLVVLGVHSPEDYNRSDLRTVVLSDGTDVKTDRYQLDATTTGGPPVEAVGVWYLDEHNQHVVRCEVRRGSATTYDVDAAAKLAQAAAVALS